MKIQHCLLVCVALLLGPAAGCRSWFYSPDWQHFDAEYDVDFPVLWSAIKLTLIDQFETLEIERAGDGTMTTGWDEHLSMLPGEGVREQAWIRVEKGEKGYKVFVRVKREANDEPIYTMESKHARWQEVADNPAKAQHLVGLIHVKMQALVEK
jgi:hypothetical protein